MPDSNAVNSDKTSYSKDSATKVSKNTSYPKNDGKSSYPVETKSVSKKMSWFIAVVLIVALLAWMFSGTFNRQPEQLADKQRFAEAKAPHEVQVRRFTLQNYSPTITLTGETIAARLVILKAERSAVVRQLPAKKGDRVEKGQLVAVLDAGSTAAKVAQSKALVNKEELYAESIAKLITKGLSSQLEQADAINRLEIARVQLMSAKDDYGKNFVKAPFSGLIIRQMVELGDYVSIGTPVFELADVSPIKIQIHITERELAHIGIQTPRANVMMPTGKKYEAVVSYISSATSGNSKTFVMEMDLQNDQDNVPLGMRVTATIILEPVAAIAISPSLMIIDNNGKLSIKYVDDGDVVRQLPVTVVQSVSDTTWVKGEGLNQKNIIVNGQGFVFEGESVTARSFISGVSPE